MADVLQRPAAALVLFDIDGTLIRRAGPHHRQALVDAVREVTGLETSTDHIPVQGMLDRTILETMLRDAGFDPAGIPAAMPALVAAAQRIYLCRGPGNLRHRVCPGVRAALRRFERAAIPLGLVTGNLTRIGWHKLGRAGLRRHFGFGAFAEQAEDRAGLVRIALRRARRHGWIGRRTRLWLVGDHENDVRAAKANRIGSVAVATGLSSRAQLSACAPDWLLGDLRALSVEMLLA